MDEEVVVGVEVVGVEGEEDEGVEVVVSVEERIVGIVEAVGEGNVNEIVLIDKVMLMWWWLTPINNTTSKHQ